MSDIIKGIRAKRGSTRTFDDFDVKSELTATRGDEVGFVGMGPVYEWEALLKVGVIFTSNDNLQDENFKSARKQLFRTLYSDLLKHTSKIENCIRSGRKEEALITIRKLEDFI